MHTRGSLTETNVAASGAWAECRSVQKPISFRIMRGDSVMHRGCWRLSHVHKLCLHQLRAAASRQPSRFLRPLQQPQQHPKPYQGFSRSVAAAPLCMAASGERYPLKPDQLPSPYRHELPTYNGGKTSLRGSLFEALRHKGKDGLPLQDLKDAVSKDSTVDDASQDVETTLKNNTHFHQQGDKWSLSIYQPLKWGMSGTGQIAEDTLEVVHMIPGAEVYAIAGRNKEKAEDFAKKHGITKGLTNDELVDDKEVELVWVSSIHTAHKQQVLPLLEKGKHVLCEKPLTVNAKEAKEMYAAADKSGKFFMAALWSRFFPAQQKLRQLVDSGALGEVLHFHGEICLPMGEEVSRLYDPESGGGALLDIGLYMITLASWTYGCRKPDEVKATAVMHKNGVDVSGLISMKFGEKGLASLIYSMEAEAPIEAKITGSKGSVILHDRAHNPTALTFTPKGGQPQLLDFPHPPKPDYIAHGPADGGFNFGGSMGFLYEVMAVHAAAVNGHTGYPDVSKEEMIQVMELCDEIRSQIGVKYPQDEEA